MSNKALILVLSLVLHSITAHAAGETQLARFKPWLAELAKPLHSSSEPAEVADSLIGGTARVSAFNLQALGRLYADQHEGFKSLRDDFKGLEDVIGKYDMWSNVLAAAESDGASETQLKKLRARRAQARQDLVTHLSEKGWVVEGPGGRLRRIERFLKGYDWPKASEDRELVLGKLAKQLKKTDETEFDLTVLEEGDGLHELRRQMRWFLIQARVLNGAVTFAPKSQGCPVADLEWLLEDPIAESKYSALPGSEIEKKPCRVSQCLFLAMVWSVEELGDVKDEAEAINNVGEHSDEVPQKLRKRAEKAYRLIKDTETLSLLRDEIKSCG